MQRAVGMDDFTFLNEESFLLLRPSGKLEVYKFVPPALRSSVPECVLSLDLPPLSSQYRYWYITMSSNPTPGHVPHFPSSSSVGSDPSNLNIRGSSSEQLYYPTPRERILACCLYIFDATQPQDTSVRSFVFFVNVATFLKPVEDWLSVMPDHCFSSPLNRGISRIHMERGESSPSAGDGGPSNGQNQPSGVYSSHIDPESNSASNPVPPNLANNGILMSIALNRMANRTFQVLQEPSFKGIKAKTLKLTPTYP